MSEPRPITDELRPQLAALWQNAYRFSFPDGARQAAEVPLGETLGIVEGGRLASFTRISSFHVRNGREWDVPMGGIGGVATWADAQGRGHVGKIMREALCVMRERGQVVSALYPFSHPFYRRYGWASCGRVRRYGPFHQRDIQPGPESSAVTALTSPDDWNAAAQVYREVEKRYFGLVRRGEWRWRKRFREVLESGGQIYAAQFDGRTEGYMLCDFRYEDRVGNHCEIPEFLFTTHRAARAMFAFLAVLPRNVCDISIQVPEMPDLSPHFPEPVQTQVRNIFMHRVVDVKGAVEQRDYPSGLAGSVIVSIQDERAPWNAGQWELAFSNGAASVRKAEGGEALPLTIEQFSDLYSGGCNVTLLHKLGVFSGGATKDWSLLDAAFGERTPALLDAF